MGFETRFKRKSRRNRYKANQALKNNSTIDYKIVVRKSNKHIFAQIINVNGEVFASASTNSKEVKLSSNQEGAIFVGKKIAEIAKNKNIEAVIFDRGAFKYHGLIKYVADSVRENGLKI